MNVGLGNVEREHISNHFTSNPLAVATGAGAEMRQSLGTAVFSGMLGVTVFGLMFTPAFYTLIRKLGSSKVARLEASEQRAAG